MKGGESVAAYKRPAPPVSYRNNEFIGDLAAWKLQNSPDNAEQMQRLRRNLRKAREQELTQRQQLMLRMYYDEGKSMTKIAMLLHINKSTVSRTIARGRKRLKRCLKYSF